MHIYYIGYISDIYRINMEIISYAYILYQTHIRHISDTYGMISYAYILYRIHIRHISDLYGFISYAYILYISDIYRIYMLCKSDKPSIIIIIIIWFHIVCIYTISDTYQIYQIHMVSYRMHIYYIGYIDICRIYMVWVYVIYMSGDLCLALSCGKRMYALVLWLPCHRQNKVGWYTRD